MYALNIHNITKIELKLTKLFNNFSSRDLEITTKNYEGKETQHTIGLYGKGHADLMPIVDGLVAHHYADDDDDTTQTAA
jgi:hypothetical protein